MSAIWGVWRRNGQPSAGEDLATMAAALRAYGQGSGRLLDCGSAGLGCALAPTVPEDDFDTQPLECAGGIAVLVADLRLDDREGLRVKLGIPESVERRMADSGILRACWEKWAEDCVDHLIGEFAFAVWDKSRRRLFCARDHFGRRAFHYCERGPLFAFATFPKGLHTLDGVPRTLDETMIATRLTFLPESAERSFFEGIKRLPPAHCLTVTRTGVTVRRYWALDTARRIVYSHDGDYVESFNEVFDESIRCRLRSRGPVGAMLSGGFDSSAVTAAAAPQLAAKGQELAAFTGVPAPEFKGRVPRERFADEGPHAAEAAALYANVRHVLVPPVQACPLDLIARPREWSETPGSHFCMTPHSHAMSQAHREHGLKTVLTGSGGNLTISYNGLPLLASLFRGGQWPRWSEEARGLIREARFGILGVLALSVGPYLPKSLWTALKPAYDLPAIAMVNPELVSAGRIEGLARQTGWDSSNRPPADGRRMRVAALLRGDTGGSAAAAFIINGVDYRDPTTDKRLAEYCLAIPEEQYLRGGQTKSLLRRAMAGRLPRVILDEWRKGVAGADWYLRIAPYGGRFRESLAQIEASPGAARCLDLGRMRRAVGNWPSGDWDEPSVHDEYRMGLCRAIQAGEFIRWVEEGH